MKRRTFIRSGAVAGVVGTAGCLGLFGGGGDETEIGHRITDDGSRGGYIINRVDFVDETGTLGQVDTGDTDVDADNLVNDYTESDWQRMDDNDLDVARNKLQNNDSSIKEIRPWVEKALNRNLDEPEIDSMDSPPGPEAPDERAIMYGIGKGINSETLIGNSIEAANTLKPLAEKFASEFLENAAFEAWIHPATLPVTKGRFVHLPIANVYSTEDDFNADYIEDGAPDTPGLPDGSQSIRSAEESVYANPEMLEYVTGFEFEKALAAAEAGKIEQEGRAHPVRSISSAMLSSMWNIVDSSLNDFSREEIPPNGLVTHVSKEFGRSVEDAFYNIDEEILQYIKNIGRGVQLFYEEKGGSSNLAVGGTLEKPTFYEFPDEMKDKLWNFKYDSLSALEG